MISLHGINSAEWLAVVTMVDVSRFITDSFSDTDPIFPILYMGLSRARVYSSTITFCEKYRAWNHPEYKLSQCPSFRNVLKSLQNFATIIEHDK